MKKKKHTSATASQSQPDLFASKQTQVAPEKKPTPSEPKTQTRPIWASDIVPTGSARQLMAQNLTEMSKKLKNSIPCN